MNSKRRIPSGIPETRPIRNPFLAPEYSLECLPHDQLPNVRNLAPNRIKIGEWQDGKKIPGYIPPVLTIQGYQDLKSWHQALQTQMENIIRMALQVIETHRTKDAARIAFCLPIVQFLRSSQGYYRWVLPTLSPIRLAAYFGDFFGLVDSLIDTGDRDFVRNLLKEGALHNLRPFGQEFLKMSNIPYEDMALIISYIRRLLDSILSTLQSLNTQPPPAPRFGDNNNQGAVPPIRTG